MLRFKNTQILDPNLPTKMDCVAETIRRAILVGDILPGQRILESDVTHALKVSSSPVREAFHQLEAEGFLVRTPYTGMKVSDMQIADPKELYSIVSLLQGVAVRISTDKLKWEDIQEAQKLNREMRKLCNGKVDVKKLRVVNYTLHMILCGVNIHPWLTRLISGLWVRFSAQSLRLIANRPREIIQEHKEIIDAIKIRDALLAETLMKRHFENTIKAL
jgi:DNA-binding GntR family transcriptional regulator